MWDTTVWLKRDSLLILYCDASANWISCLEFRPQKHKFHTLAQQTQKEIESLISYFLLIAKTQQDLGGGGWLDYDRALFKQAAEGPVMVMPPHRLDNVHKYYQHLNLLEPFALAPTSLETVLKLLEEINPSKAKGLYNIAGRFLKDGAAALVEPITELCNLSIL